MKKNVTKIVSVILTAALIFTTGITAVFAIENNSTKESLKQETATAVDDSESEETTKNETVYVIAGADGSIKKLIVSDWLKNALTNQKLEDSSELKDIVNVKGDEGFSSNESGIIWDASGNDIYYQGTIEKELPVSFKITYTLDGKAISASDIAGKSGKVTIRIDYTNNCFENVTIDGNETKIYVPFAMLTGILLDNDIFTNIEVQNGKTVNDGDRTAVVGVAFPGLKENLAIDTDVLDIPSYVEITADAKNFALNSTVTVATNEIFNNIPDGSFEKADELTNDMNKLTDAMNSLMDGSSKLYGGICTLLEKSGRLVEGINALAEGAAALKNGSNELKNGALTLYNGTVTLSDALSSISENSGKLNAGADQVFSSLLSSASSQLAASGITGIPTLTKDNYKAVLEGVIASLSDENVKEMANQTALSSVTSEVNANRPTIENGVTAKIEESVRAQVTQVVRQNVTSQVLATMGLTEDSYAAGIQSGAISQAQQDAVEVAVDNAMQGDAAKSAIDTNTAAKMAEDDIKAMIEQKTDEQVELLISQNMQSAAVTSQIDAAVESARSGRESIKGAIAQLDSFNEFHKGIASYTAGVDKVSEGSESVKAGAEGLYNGSTTLDNGIAELLDGILTLKNGTPELVSGIEQLRDGSESLYNGLVQFDDEGIQKLSDLVNGDMAQIIVRARATVEVSKNYTSFAGIADGMDGSVKFIYRTDSVK